MFHVETFAKLMKDRGKIKLDVCATKNR